MPTYEHNPNRSPLVGDQYQPVLNGEVFCSPTCGASCKKAEYDRAMQAATDLASRLGSGWRPDVWENLGWHYAAKKSGATVSPTYRHHKGSRAHTGFLVLIQIDGAATFDAEDADPRIAVSKALEDIKALQKRLDLTALSLEQLPLEIEDVI